MKLTEFRVSLLVISIIFICSSCRKPDVIVANIPERGGIALTFDDYNIDNWYKYVKLFDSLNVKCTFYVSNFNKLSERQINELHEIQNHGHEIAFHSTNHLNFVEAMQSEGYKTVIQKEVNKGLELMNKNGFFPTTFAYPYGAHNLILDKGLLKKFKSIRILNGTHDLNNSLSSLSGNTLLRGLGIDESSKRGLSHICDLLKTANELNKCAVLLIHNIEMHGSDMQLPLWKLKNLVQNAKDQHLHFYTISEISRN